MWKTKKLKEKCKGSKLIKINAKMTCYSFFSLFGLVNRFIEQIKNKLTYTRTLLSLCRRRTILISICVYVYTVYGVYGYARNFYQRRDL